MLQRDMGKQGCHALTGAGNGCQNPVEEEADRCPAGHVPASV